MDEDNVKIEDLVAGGLIGAGLGAILAKDKEEGALIGALLGAIFIGTIQANKEAVKANLPIVTREGNKLMYCSPNGKKRELKALRKPEKKFPAQFKLSTYER